ncbi:MAG TPA: MarR family winged helix-turn-helix transcriptional regulator [Nocardioides sp.]|uniref:MarR family winged helix-turn-helix transcriptional regulator n=1 Tax=Nocardioides sp. TaxID=35761 RepID=UPI002F3FFB5C
MPAPRGTPIGLRLAGVARDVGRAFDDALASAGGSRPMWMVLLALKSGAAASQQQVADHIGIRGATLTHHLSGMEERGLVVRTREPGDRRTQVVRLTEEGERMFVAMAGAAQEFDKRLRRGLTAAEVSQVDALLQRLQENAGVRGPKLPGDAAT